MVYRTMQVIGPILLATGFTLLAVGIVATVHLKNNLPVPQTSVTNAVSQLTFSVENINNLQPCSKGAVIFSGVGQKN